MSAITEKMDKLGERVGHSELRKRTAALEHARDAHELNELITRHSIAHSELASTLGLHRSKLHQIVNEAIEKGAMDEVQRDVNKYNYTLRHVHQLFDYLDQPRWLNDFKECVVMAISNLKGGTGKSSTTIHLAVALALDLMMRPRVLVVDLDPQGSLSSYGLTAEDDETNIVTAIDISLGNFENEMYQALVNEGFTHDDVINAALIETHIPNLHIMPALTHDERFVAAYYGAEESQRPNVLKSFRDEVIEKVKDDYDIILIDTGPRNDPLSWAAFEAANAVLTPVSPRTLDWNATGLFLRSLSPTIEEVCPSKGENLKWFKVAPVNVEITYDRDKAMVNAIMQESGLNAITNHIVRSPAFELANSKYVSVFDLKKKDSNINPKHIDSAVNSVKSFAHEVKMSLATVFGAYGNE